MILVTFLHSICRMRTPPGTKRNNGKRQEHADNCRNMQKSNATKNAYIKTPIENLQAAECNQLQRTPIFKIGGGGARAARRIQIRRPRLAEPGAKACRTFTRNSAEFRASERPRPIHRPCTQTARKSPFADPETLNLRFLTDFWPIENLLKN